MLKPRKRHLRRPVDGDEQVELPLFRSNLGDVDMEIADCVVGESARLGFSPRELGQAADAVPLEAAVLRQSGQGRIAWLQAVKAVIEREQRVAPEGDDDRLLLECE